MTKQGELIANLKTELGVSTGTYNELVTQFLVDQGYSATLGYNGMLYQYLTTQLNLTSGDHTLTELQHMFAVEKGVSNWDVLTDLTPLSFNVLDLPSLGVWYKTVDTSQSNINTTGNLVNSITDKSGNGFNVSQTVTAQKPTSNTNTQNGRNVVIFDGSDDNMNIDSGFTIGTSDFTIIYAGKLSNSTAQNIVLSSSTSSTHRPFIVRDVGYRTRIGAINYDITATPELGQFGITCAVFDRDGLLKVYRDGVLKGSVNISAQAATDINDQLRIMASSAVTSLWGGDLGEMIICKAALSDGDREATELYLSSEWNVAI